jgi:hypothetical protein
MRDGLDAAGDTEVPADGVYGPAGVDGAGAGA